MIHDNTLQFLLWWIFGVWELFWSPVITYVIRPFFIAFFTTLGAGTPIALLLFQYSRIEKKRLMGTIPIIETELDELEISKKVSEDLMQKYATKSKELTGSNKVVADNSIEKLMEHWNATANHIVDIGIRIGELQNRINYIKTYGFWTLIENVLERKYIGASSPSKTANAEINKRYYE